mgnify:CR=1 FL=1
MLDDDQGGGGVPICVRCGMAGDPSFHVCGADTDDALQLAVTTKADALTRTARRMLALSAELSVYARERHWAEASEKAEMLSEAADMVKFGSTVLGGMAAHRRGPVLALVKPDGEALGSSE